MNIQRDINLGTIAFNEFDREYKRQYALRLSQLVVPCSDGNVFHDYITQGRHKWNKYSSCGDWWNFIPWMLGCTNPSIINRDDREAGLLWHVEENISRTKNGAVKCKAWVPYSKNSIPNSGDLLFMGFYPKEQEHVCMVEKLEGDTLTTSDFGQFTEGKKCSLRIKRKWQNGRLYSTNGNSRGIVGWINLCEIPLGRYAVNLDEFVKST